MKQAKTSIEKTKMENLQFLNVGNGIKDSTSKIVQPIVPQIPGKTVNKKRSDKNLNTKYHEKLSK